MRSRSKVPSSLLISIRTLCDGFLLVQLVGVRPLHSRCVNLVCGINLGSCSQSTKVRRERWDVLEKTFEASKPKRLLSNLAAMAVCKPDTASTTADSSRHRGSQPTMQKLQRCPLPASAKIKSPFLQSMSVLPSMLWLTGRHARCLWALAMNRFSQVLAVDFRSPHSAGIVMRSLQC
jgi:hypothetical protein